MIQFFHASRQIRITSIRATLVQPGQARPCSRTLAPANPDGRPAPGQVADRNGLGRRAGTSWGGRLAGWVDPADGAVWNQRTAGPYQRIPVGSGRLAQRRAAGSDESLSADN